MEFTALVNKMVIFLVLMVIGYVCARRGFTDASFTRITSKLVINVFMNATILKSVFEMDSAMTLLELGQDMLFLFLTIILCFVLGFLAMKLFRIDADHAPLFELLSSLGNTMFIGLPVADALLGARGVFFVFMSNIPFNVILYTYGVWRLKSGTEETLHLKDILTVPLISTVLALLIFILHPPIPAVVRELANAMSGATMPLSMLVIGSSLGSVSLLDAFRNKQLYLSSCIRLLVAPLLVNLVMSPLVADPTLLLTCVIIAACPGAVMISILAIQYNRDYVYSSEGVLHATALSLLTIPLLMYYLA